MTLADILTMRRFIDLALEDYKATGLMVMSGHIPPEMRDETSVSAYEDSLPWKPIPSTVTDEDIQELEARTGLRYPRLYVEFLQYQHFYWFLPVNEITFYQHVVGEWKQVLLEQYYDGWSPDQLIEKGYIPFADYSDWGIVCFDTNTQKTQDDECAIVMFDHELLFDDPVPREELYSSFSEMMRSLLATLEASAATPWPE